MGHGKKENELCAGVRRCCRLRREDSIYGWGKRAREDERTVRRQPAYDALAYGNTCNSCSFTTGSQLIVLHFCTLEHLSNTLLSNAGLLVAVNAKIQ